MMHTLLRVTVEHHADCGREVERLWAKLAGGDSEQGWQQQLQQQQQHNQHYHHSLASPSSSSSSSSTHLQQGGREEASAAAAAAAKLRARGLDNARDALDMLLDWVAQCGAERQVRACAC
jgi:hypothetical protein